MKIKTLAFLFFVILFYHPLRSQEINSNVEDKIKIFEAWIESKIEYENWPGLVTGIVYDQKLIWTKGFGFADIEKKTEFDEYTLFPIASNTKMFTAIGILKLRDEGRLQLDDPVVKYLPWFDKIKQNNNDSKRITIRHLLTHTSGLPSEGDFNYWSNATFPELTQIVEKIEQQELCFATDVGYKYSNLGIALVGAIISEVSRLPYSEYIKQNILVPLEMNHSGFNLQKEQERNFAIGYGRIMPDGKRSKVIRSDKKAFTAAFGLNSTINDLAKFAAWQFRIRETGEFEIINGSTLREMQHVHWVDKSWEFGLGLGFFIYHKKPNDLIGHGGHLEGYHTDFTIIPNDKIAVITLANADDIPVYPDVPGSVSKKIFDLIVPEIKKTIVPAEQPEKIDSVYQKYIGIYRNYTNDYKILFIQGSLVFIDPKSNNPENSIIKLQPVRKNVFRAISDDVNRNYGEVVTFDEDDTGKIKNMKMRATTWPKIED
ncbi:beta-lactamase family protein [bacterium]|nr:beta-lactamase family protein [bacterium]